MPIRAPHQGQPRRWRLFRRQRQDPAARRRQGRRKRYTRQGSTAARLPADRRQSAYNRPCRTCCSARTPPCSPTARSHHRPGLGGTGALKIGADYLKRLNPNAKVYISDPSWENHRALFESAGFVVENYPYYDAATRGVNFDGMKACLKPRCPPVDRRPARLLPQPDRRRPDRRAMGRSRRRVPERDLVPFLDMAYQGFADGIDADAVGRPCLSRPPACSSSSPAPSRRTSRSTASASAPCPSSPPARTNRPRVMSQVKRVIRTNYSNPPTHGGAIVARCCPTPNCASSGKPNWPACATASAPCAPPGRCHQGPGVARRISPS
jgi:aspartate/tyrosine/aromatic aminotransferase